MISRAAAVMKSGHFEDHEKTSCFPPPGAIAVEQQELP